MGNTEPIGIAVLGCGAIAPGHLRGWQRLVAAGKARLAVVCDTDLGRAERAAAGFGVAAVSTDFEEAVRRPEVQAVDICLPHHLHLPAIQAAARAGKHVLCEKPLALNLAEALQAVRDCQSAGIVFMTADRDRFEPHARAVKRLIDQGLLGQVNMVLERHLLHKDVLLQARLGNMGWKLDKRTSGGGVLHREGCYYLDTLIYWEGSGVAHITGAEFDNFLWETEEIETTAHILFRFRSGAIGVFEMAWCLQGPHIREITINGSEGSLRLTGALSGEDAVITLHSRQLERRILDDPLVTRALEDCDFRRSSHGYPDRSGESLVIRIPYAEGFHAQEVEFISAIHNGHQPESTGLDGARALEVVEAAYLAARERRTIPLPLVDWSALA